MWTLANAKIGLKNFLVLKWLKYLDVKLNVFKKDDNKQFQLVQSYPKGDADSDQFMRLRDRLIIAAEKFGTGEIFTSVLIPTLSKDLDEQLILARKLVDVVDRANRKICVTLLRFNVVMPESSDAQVRIFARKKDDEKFQQIVYVIYKLEEFIYLLDVFNSVFDKVITNQPICNVL